METFLVQTLYLDLKRADADPNIELHHVQINALADLEFNDFDHIEELFAAGKETMDVYLSAPQPRDIFEPETARRASRWKRSEACGSSSRRG